MMNKIVILIYLFLSITIFSHSQNTIHSSYSSLQLRTPYNTTVKPEGYQLINYNTTSNTAIITASAHAERAINYIGINKSDFLYSIEGVLNQTYNIISYNIQNNFSSLIAKTNLTWDGGINVDARTSGMAIDNNDKGWVVAYSVINGKNYLTSFNTSNTGTVDNVLVTPYILNTDLDAVQINDLAFDKFNNLYALAIDLKTGYQYIYNANNDVISNTATGGNITLQLKWQITNENNAPIALNAKYMNTTGNFMPFDSYTAEGIAFSENNCLLISVDKMSFNSYQNTIAGKVINYIYALKLTNPTTVSVTRSTVSTSSENQIALSYCSDLTSNYYPAFNPLTFSNVSAVMNGNQLQIVWSTKTERNNVKFQIEVSKDGNTFFTAGHTNTKALQGNSNADLIYYYTYDLTNAPLHATFPLVSILLTLSLLSKYGKYKKSIPLYLFVSLLLIACSKNNNNSSNIYSGKLFIKITAIDTDGATISSKVVQATNK